MALGSSAKSADSLAESLDNYEWLERVSFRNLVEYYRAEIYKILGGVSAREAEIDVAWWSYVH